VPVGPRFISQVTITPADKYRFAKFAWKLTAGKTVNGISIQINNLRNVNPTLFGRNGFTIFGLPYDNINQAPMVIFYRFSDQASGGVINGNTYSTPWVSATNVISTPDTGSEFIYIAQNPAGSVTQTASQNSFENEVVACGVEDPGATPFTYVNNVLSIPVFPPLSAPGPTIVVPATPDIYFYVLIGMPMSYDIGFDTVSAFYF
jgi:hypothetical protein